MGPDTRPQRICGRHMDYIERGVYLLRGMRELLGQAVAEGGGPCGPERRNG